MRENRLSQHGKELYECRKQTIERSFADSKNNHGYRYAMYKGLEKNQNYTWLICAAQNMKTIAIRETNKRKRLFGDTSYNVNILTFCIYLENKYKNYNFFQKITNPVKKILGLSTLCNKASFRGFIYITFVII